MKLRKRVRLAGLVGLVLALSVAKPARATGGVVHWDTATSGITVYWSGFDASGTGYNDHGYVIFDHNTGTCGTYATLSAGALTGSGSQFIGTSGSCNNVCDSHTVEVEFCSTTACGNTGPIAGAYATYTGVGDSCASPSPSPSPSSSPSPTPTPAPSGSPTATPYPVSVVQEPPGDNGILYILVVLNTWFIAIADAILSIWPSTPPALKTSVILTSIIGANPGPWWLLGPTAAYVASMLTCVAIYKAWMASKW